MYKSLKGFNDILPDESAQWVWLEEHIRELMRLYGFGEIRLPIVESTELFRRSIGEGTDVVGKEMYTFFDRSDPPESLTLRPELTASAARAWVEHAAGQISPLTKWYYVGPAFRYEQPQAGRFRQYHTFGIEIFGSAYPETDVEVITVAADLLDRVGLSRYRLRLNSIGTAEERAAYRTVLLEFLDARREQLSPESQRRMHANPLRVLDSKRAEDIKATVGAPSILDFLGEESRNHFAAVGEMLEADGIAFEIDTRLVRGLDYYSRTAFEFQGLDLGAQDALIGGGRYDALVEEVGGKPTPAIGFGVGLERILLALRSAERLPHFPAELDVYLVGLDPDARAWASAMAHELRRRGRSAEVDLLRRSMKAQMRDANRRGAARVVIAGSSEMEAREAQVKDMVAGTQQSIPFDRLLDHLTTVPAAAAASTND